VIVSASFRTDIPAHYGEWFRARLAAGFARVASPYGGPPARVALDPAAAEGFVFWTRNPGPFLPVLDALAAAGRPFYLSFTITGYPRALESGVLETARALALAREVAARFGPRALVWRYDPILDSTLTPLAWHTANFARLADALAGATDEAVVSFVQPYRKTRRNLDAAARAQRFAWRDPAAEEKRALLPELAAIARERGMRLALCAQPELLAEGVAEARCVDAGRLGAIAGRPLAAREKGNRPGCRCHESRDIGAYDSCAQGCVYCYAVSSRRAAQARLRRHDPAGEFLIPPE
jgi:hypothetical protein